MPAAMAGVVTPASIATGCNSKRAIITYAPRASIACLVKNFTKPPDRLDPARFPEDFAPMASWGWRFGGGREAQRGIDAGAQPGIGEGDQGQAAHHPCGAAWLTWPQRQRQPRQRQPDPQRVASQPRQHRLGR